MNTTFSVWQTDEPEFMKDAAYKFNVMTHPLDMALGTHGKNDHLAIETISVLADWALHKLFIACAKVFLWCGTTIIKRKLEWIKKRT